MFVVLALAAPLLAPFGEAQFQGIPQLQAPSARHLFGSPGAATSQAWPMQHPVPAALIWAVVILAVFVPLAVRRYQRAGR